MIFKKFATLITSTVLFSLIYSLLFFGSLSHFLGPQRRCGSLYCIFCCHRCHKKKNLSGEGGVIQLETATREFTLEETRENGN